MLAIIVLQYGRWRDTVACLQSLVPSVRDGLARVIVVDNQSPDDSVASLHAWISGALPPSPRPVHDTVAAYWWPLLGAATAWTVRDAGHTSRAPDSSPWTLVQSDANRGFAAGMNQGIRVALEDPQVDAVWLLNNDTVVSPTSVAAIRASLVGQWRLRPWIETAPRPTTGITAATALARGFGTEPVSSASMGERNS